MKFFKKYSFWFICLGIAVLYFFTRFYNILALPLFTDEAIYVRWAQIASNDAAWRFISLTDGKQPMFVWIAMVLMKVIEEPLLAGRVVSVLAGIGSMVGLFFLTNELFKNRKIALLASFLYVLYPFSLVYDRMALYDSLVSMFIIWSLFFEILLVRYKRLDIALILGMIIGGGMLTKTNANFAFILLPFLLLLIDYKKKIWKQDILKLTGLSLVSLVVANAMYAVLRLSPFFYIIEEKNYVFIYPFIEWINHPFTFFIPNITALSEWTLVYLSLPFFVLVLSAFLVGKKHWKEKLLLFVWFIVPFVISALFFKLAYPRHILFTTMPLLILGAYALYHLVRFAPKMWLKVMIPIVFLVTFVFNDYFIITDFNKASVPQTDKGQFVQGWPSGLGVKETVAFLEEQAKDQDIYVATAGTFGLMPYALEIYLVDNPNVTIKGFWPIDSTIPEEVIKASKTMP
ncbi:MAG TPA: glycosyltransferase family 39 protein, partial [Patescibacteria group bacterium]|nr:glycosyltransferase family 39 protein [Patescibacteria group bacterium]